MTLHDHADEALPSLDKMEVPGERFVEAGASTVLALLFACIAGGLVGGWFIYINATQVFSGTGRLIDATRVTIAAEVQASALSAATPNDTARVAFATRDGAIGPWVPALISDITGPCRETIRGPVGAAPSSEPGAECRITAVLIGDPTLAARIATSPIPVRIELRVKRDRAIRVLAGRVLNRMPAQR